MFGCGNNLVNYYEQDVKSSIENQSNDSFVLE